MRSIYKDEIKHNVFFTESLRETEQDPRLKRPFKLDEVLEMLDYLDKIGVGYYEIPGYCGTHPMLYERNKNVLNQTTSDIKFRAHCRSLEKDIDVALNLDVKYVGVYIGISKPQLKQLRMTLDEAVGKFESTIDYARDHGLQIRATLEDATRAKMKDVLETLERVGKYKEVMPCIADTVGIASPWMMEKFVSELKTVLGQDKPIEVHCHNDLGNSVANAITAIRSGANCATTSVIGGERNGITSLVQLIANLFDKFYGFEKFESKLQTAVNLTKYAHQQMELIIPENVPVMGENIFTHTGGTHQHKVRNSPVCYDVFNPSLVGKLDKMILGPQTGRAAIESVLAKSEIKLTEDQIEFVRTRILTRNMTPEDLTESVYNILVKEYSTAKSDTI